MLMFSLMARTLEVHLHLWPSATEAAAGQFCWIDFLFFDIASAASLLPPHHSTIRFSRSDARQVVAKIRHCLHRQLAAQLPTSAMILLSHFDSTVFHHSPTFFQQPSSLAHTHG